MKKKAMAIEIILIFATIMGTLGLFLLKSAKSYNKQLEISTSQLQSYFIARAGVEHVMLKVKLLNREFYDAICISQGRSPLFNYKGINISQPYSSICASNPGPIFLFTNSESSSFNPSGVFSTPPSSEAGYWNMLDVFKEDIRSNCNGIPNLTNLPADINGILGPINSQSGTSDGFSGFQSAQYLLEDLDLGALKVETASPNTIDNTIAVNFSIRSTYNSVKGQSYDYEIKRTVTVSREASL